MTKPTKQQLEELSSEALERSYGSLKMDPDKATEALKQRNSLKVRQIWRGLRI